MPHIMSIPNLNIALISSQYKAINPTNLTIKPIQLPVNASTTIPISNPKPTTSFPTKSQLSLRKLKNGEKYLSHTFFTAKPKSVIFCTKVGSNSTFLNESIQLVSTLAPLVLSSKLVSSSKPANTLDNFPALLLALSIDFFIAFAKKSVPVNAFINTLI